MAENIALELEASLDISVVEKLHESLNNITQNGDVINLDAGSVERLDTAVFQLLYSYQQSMDKKHASVFFVNPSEAFIDNATLLGMHETLNIKH
ncbi:MAG: STAS domain-containing protein [Pseudomonadales bacterium]|nr:STAS domain-containing protein [Pseudomonadales bacterium]